MYLYHNEDGIANFMLSPNMAMEKKLYTAHLKERAVYQSMYVCMYV